MSIDQLREMGITSTSVSVYHNSIATGDYQNANMGYMLNSAEE